MSKHEHSKYQEKAIKGYYDNLDTIMLTKLGELVTELYLAKDTSKEDRLWERVEKAMTKLKVKPQIAQHIMLKRDVKVLAMNLQDWQKGIPGR